YRNIWDIGISRAGMTWILSDVNDRAKAAVEQGRNDPALKWLKQVHSQELPVLIHTAGSEGVVNTARMWRVTYDTRAVLSHGSFDGWMVAEAVAKIGIPVNHGPRTIDYYSSRNGRINGSAAAYQAADPDNFSLNTDSGVVPQEEFFLQGSMGARYGGDGYGMLRALTIHPARAIGIDHRVGSLEVGKDADIVVRAGNPLDPRNPVELVLIDGEVHYDSEVDGQWF
ncbi:MAG: imidazolonepropionase-like amidohydrolase, partial [Planctomycetota bacterium]